MIYIQIFFSVLLVMVTLFNIQKARKETSPEKWKKIKEELKNPWEVIYIASYMIAMYAWVISLIFQSSILRSVAYGSGLVFIFLLGIDLWMVHKGKGAVVFVVLIAVVLGWIYF